MQTFTDKKTLQDFLEKKVLIYNDPSFICADPISVPHRFSKKPDIEIAGLFAAVFAWGNRTTIIRKSNELINGMDNAPYDFIRNHRAKDRKRFLNFKHRTFNPTDLFYFLDFLQAHYNKYDSLEFAFLPETKEEEKMSSTVSVSKNEIVKNALSVFYKRFFALENAPRRTQKHISTPEKNAACKRLNMYLRWMVRQDNKGVDFGIWKNISPAQLICPIDLHVARVARRLNILRRTQTDWQTAVELTEALRT